MALNLYRRHRPGCEGGHPYDSRSGEFEERKKSWRRCACPIFASGTLQAKFKRQTTGQNDWEAARAVADQFEQAGIWGGSKPDLPPQAPLSVQHKNLTTIVDACKLFLDELAETAARAGLDSSLRGSSGDPLGGAYGVRRGKGAKHVITSARKATPGERRGVCGPQGMNASISFFVGLILTYKDVRIRNAFT